MNYSKRFLEDRVRPLARISVIAFLTLLISGLSSAPQKEYFTEDELDTIRDAQEIHLRVPAYLKLAERRLIALGVMEQSEKDKERERKEREKYEKEKKKGGAKAAELKPLLDITYLKDFTRTELIRGYIQALEEVESNIDDAYSRKADVRGAIEDLEKFTRETVVLLNGFESKNEGERIAKEEAIEKAQHAIESANEALKVVPKTEKKR